MLVQVHLATLSAFVAQMKSLIQRCVEWAGPDGDPLSLPRMKREVLPPLRLDGFAAPRRRTMFAELTANLPPAQDKFSYVHLLDLVWTQVLAHV